MLIEDATALAECCEKLARGRAIGVDTEFVRERTYRAKLCLVQLAGEDGSVYCVDTIKVGDLSALGELFRQQAIVFVFHAAKQDIEVLAQNLTVIPQHVYDTQLAAAFCSYGDQLGYANLVERLCDVSLDKLATRTDWTKRPLTTKQLTYAMEDVRYLLALRESLDATLGGFGRQAWLDEERRQLSDPDQYVVEPMSAWERVRGVGNLDGVQRGRLRSLAAWRERTADTADLPREWVIKDRALLNIAKLALPTMDDLAEVDELATKQRERWGAQIIEAVVQQEDHGQIPRPPRMTSAQEKLRKRLMNYLRTRTEAMDLSTALVANRRDVEALILGLPGSSLLRGWRRGLIGEELVQVLNGYLKKKGSESFDL